MLKDNVEAIQRIIDLKQQNNLSDMEIENKFAKQFFQMYYEVYNIAEEYMHNNGDVKDLIREIKPELE